MNPQNIITLNELAGTLDAVAEKLVENAKRLLSIDLVDLALVELERAVSLRGAVCILINMEGWKE